MTPRKPTNPTAFQTVTLTTALRDAARAAADRFAVLDDTCKTCREHVSSIVVDLEFENSDMADKGELLLCEILVRSNPAVVDEIIKSFPGRVNRVLKPVLKSLSQLKRIAPESDPTLEKINSVQNHLRKLKSKAMELTDDLRRKKDNQSWDAVAIAWVEANCFLEEMSGLRWKAIGVENEFMGKTKKKLGRPPTVPIADAQFGPVTRIDSEERSEERVDFDSFIKSWPTKLCRRIARIANTNCHIQVLVAELEMVSRFDALINHCGPLNCGFIVDKKIETNHLSAIGEDFNNLIAAMGPFCMKIQALPSREVYGNSDQRVTIDLINSELTELAEIFVKRIKEAAEGGANYLESTGKTTIAGIRAVTQEFKETVAPILDLNRNPRMATARAEAIKAGIPEVVILEIQKINFGSKFPTTDMLFKRFQGTTLRNKLTAGEHGLSRATIGRWLTTFKTILRKHGIPAGETRIRANASPKIPEPKLTSGEPSKDHGQRSKAEKKFNIKAIPGQEAFNADNGGKTEESAQSGNPAELAQQREEKEILLKAMGILPEKYHVVLTYKFIHNMMPEDIATELEMDIKTVNILIRMGTKWLKKSPEVEEILEAMKV